MKIEKIKNYNQKLLAVSGTIIAILVIVTLISFILMIVQEQYPYNHHDNSTGILSDEKIEQLQKENKREQVISYETPKLIDTLNSVYIVPVSHRNLKEEENINDLLNLHSSPNDLINKTDHRYSDGFYGMFNNIILYHSNEETNKKLFNKRVNFNEINTEYFEDEILLLIKASERDSYKDGVINLLDFKSLYIYSFSQQKLKKVGIQGMDIYHYEFINNSKNLIIEFGVDRNGDGRFKKYNEPTIIKKYDFESGLITDIVSENINSELQKTLEGTKD